MRAYAAEGTAQGRNISAFAVESRTEQPTTNCRARRRPASICTSEDHGSLKLRWYCIWRGEVLRSIQARRLVGRAFVRAHGWQSSSQCTEQTVDKPLAAGWLYRPTIGNALSCLLVGMGVTASSRTWIPRLHLLYPKQLWTSVTADTVRVLGDFGGCQGLGGRPFGYFSLDRRLSVGPQTCLPSAWLRLESGL